MEKRITYVTLLLVLTSLTSCSPRDISAKEDMLKNKTFVHLYFPSEKECIDSQPEPDFFYNCHQQVDFYKNNLVELMLTDIIWKGTYKTENNFVILNFEPNHEIPGGEIKFEIIHPNDLLRVDDLTLWQKTSGNSIWN